MATYLIGSETTITRQEGDSADIVMVVPDTLDMDSYPNVKLQVKTTKGVLLIDKATGSGISVTGQTITVTLNPVDTKNRSGRHKWECEINDGTNYITIARGPFEIEAELIL